MNPVPDFQLSLIYACMLVSYATSHRAMKFTLAVVSENNNKKQPLTYELVVNISHF